MNQNELMKQLENSADLGDFPICKNCKYFINEKVGAMQIAQVCGLTAIDPVTGQPSTRPKLAASMRRDTMPCGVGGKFYEKKKVKPAPKKENIKAKAPEAEVIEVKVPVIEEEPEQPKKEAPKRRRGRPKAE